MAQSIIPNVSPGTIIGSSPTFPTNAILVGDFLYVRDANGNMLPGRTVDAGDEVTVLDISGSKQFVLLQYPTSRGYVQGYVNNDTNIIKYKNGYNWANGSTSEPVYDLDKTTQIGSLDPRETAIILYKVDGMTAVAYDTGKGKLTKSGLVHYAGSGNSNSSSAGSSFNGIRPGDVVSEGFTYPNNAEVIGDELYLRDQNGNRIQGRSVSIGDKITVLDVGYTKQLALVQYPAGNVVRQGYVTNAPKLIRYFKPYEWHNGSTLEEVLDESNHKIGSLSPYESATPLYKKNGLTHVVYNTNKGPHTKSGFVKYEGGPAKTLDIPYITVPGAEQIEYGKSGLGRPLIAHKIGNGTKALVFVCEVHGFEDNWPKDGLALVTIGNKLIKHLASNGTNGWSVYVIPSANPDGLAEGYTDQGPGRCTIVGGVDINRDFPIGFSKHGSSRNWSGDSPLSVNESKCLSEFLINVKSNHNELFVIDLHGWEGSALGDNEIKKYFLDQFPGSRSLGFDRKGFLTTWTKETLGATSALIELPRDTRSLQQVLDREYPQKVIRAVDGLLSISSGGNSNNSSSSTTVSNNESSYNTTGTVINIQSYLNVRQGPGTEYNSIGKLYQGNSVEIVAKSGSWYKIKFGSSYGYVFFDYISLDHNNISSSLENWQQDCIKRGWGPLTKEGYFDRINSIKIYNTVKEDLDKAFKEKKILDIINPLNLNTADMITFSQAIFNNETTSIFRNEWYDKSNPNLLKKKKRLAHGQEVILSEINIKHTEKLSTRIPKAIKTSAKDALKFKFMKGLDGWLTSVAGAASIYSDICLFYENGELKSIKDISEIVASVVIVNGLEIAFCSFIAGLVTQLISPEFPIVAAVVGAAFGAIYSYIASNFLYDNKEMETFIKNALESILNYLF